MSDNATGYGGQNYQVRSLRILIVDNDPKWQRRLSELVAGWGHTPVIANSPEDCPDLEQGLLDDAVKMVTRHRCQIAIVDMCLKHDGDLKDKSGLELIPQLEPAAPIMISAYADTPHWRVATSLGVRFFFRKAEDPEALHFAIQSLAKSLWHQGSKVEVDWRHKEFKDSQAVVHRFFPDDPDIPSEQADDVLRRLLPEATTKITITDLSLSTGAPTLMLRPRSLVVKAFIDNIQRPVVVKLMRRERVDKEVSGYELVKANLAAARFAYRPTDPIKLWDMGGVRYFLVGGNQSFDLFSEFYKEKSVDKIVFALERLNQLLMSLYESSTREMETLFEAYEKVWGKGWYEELLKLEESFITVEDYPELFHDLQLMNPISWLGDKKDGSLLEGVKKAVTHGDLQGDNILIDEDGFAWVIDYERTGPGHILQDWVELETDILTRLALKEADTWDEFFQQVRPLLERKELRGFLTEKDAGEHVANKATVVINVLRSLARASSNCTNGQEYYWGLLLNSLFRLGILLKQRAEGKQGNGHSGQFNQLSISRCLFLGGMICHRLDNWSREWPPKEWTKYPKHLVTGRLEAATQDTNTPVFSLSDQGVSLHREATRETRITVLHLSDIHLGAKSQAEVYYSQLETDLLHGIECKQLDYLVLNGDMADGATKSDYEAAQLLIDKIVKRFRLKRSAIIIVPGNHDVDYSSSRLAYGRFAFDPILAEDSGKRSIKQPYGQILCDDERLYQQRFANFAHFFQAIRKKPYPLLSSEQALIWQFPYHKLLFLGLNSAVEIDHHHEKRAEIDRLGLANGLQQLTGKYDDWLKIAVWHHPIQGSEAMNAEFIEQLTMRGFQICMHGHIHEAIEDYHKYDDKQGVRVIGAGTFGAPVRQQNAGIPLQYNLVTLSPATCTVQVDTRKKEKPDGAWSADARWGDKSRDPQPRYSFKVNWGLCAASHTE